jgi:hypothetical protein
MKLSIPEVLTKVNKATSHQDKVLILREYVSLPLEQVLQYNFHPDIKFSLPEGPAPYKKESELPVGMSHTNLYQEARRLYIFLDGYAPNLKPYKKEALFIELLEGLHHTEAEVMNLVKDKKLTDLYPNVTYEAAYEAFFELLPHPSMIPKKIPNVEIVEIRENKKEEVTPVEHPLELPVQTVKKPKRVMTEKWKASLVRAQEARKLKAAQKRMEEELANPFVAEK